MRTVARIAALVAAVVVGATPLVARAITDESVANAATTSEPRLAQRPVTPIPDLGAELATRPAVDPAPALAPEQPVDPVIVILADTYAWDEQSLRVAVLQETVGLAVDGRYGMATQRAHRHAAEFVGLPTDTLPTPVLPAGPDPSKWEALRQCESNGNYSITSRTGKYRGAYQFDRSTWNSVAERFAPDLVGVDPAAASPADQDAMALALYSERGARPWPHCGRHLS
jgi:hypothetical protein